MAKMITIGITGGAGFIGFSLANYLSKKKNNKIIIIDNLIRSNKTKKIIETKGNIKFYKTNIKNQNQLIKNLKYCDIVIHLAAINGTENFYTIPDEIIDVSSKGIINVVEACKRNNIQKLLIASSSEVYNNPIVIPTDEKVPLIIPDVMNPRFSYSGGKIFSELYSIHYASIYIKDVIIFRPHNVYGPDMGTKHVIPEFILKFLKQNQNKKNILIVKGDGNQIRSFIYIDDFLRAIDLLLKKGKTGIYNIGNNKPVKIIELINIIASKMDVSFSLKKISKPRGDILKRIPNIKKIKKIGFKNKLSLSKGLDKTISWYKKNYNKIKKNNELL